MRAPVDWIPEVAKGANAFYDLEPGTMADLIYRLGTDKRLAGVWRTLAQARQDKDITALFGIAVGCAFACCNDMLTVIARRELERLGFARRLSNCTISQGCYEDTGIRKSGLLAKRPRCARGLRAVGVLI